MSHHPEGDHEFFDFTRHTNTLRVFFAPNCRFEVKISNGERKIFSINQEVGGKVQKSLSSKAANCLPCPAGRTRYLVPGAYGLVREDGKASTCLREAAFSLRSHFGEGRERRW